MIEAYWREEDHTYLLRNTETGEDVPGFGPYYIAKTANRQAKRLNEANGVTEEVTPDLELEPSLEPPVRVRQARTKLLDDGTTLTISEELKAPEALDAMQLHATAEEKPRTKASRDTPGKLERETKEAVKELAKTPEPKQPPALEVVEAPLEDGKVATSTERHAWLEDAADFALGVVTTAGGKPTGPVRVSIGWPMLGRKFVGECWHSEASSDGSREIFISPVRSDGVRLISTLIHEMVHACLPKEVKHGKPFRDLGSKAGLTGKPASMSAGPELLEMIGQWIADHGVYPAGSLSLADRKKQSTRLLKAECLECGLTFRITKKWVDAVEGRLFCPAPDCGGTMDMGD